MTHQEIKKLSPGWLMAPMGDVTVEKVDQMAPDLDSDFAYVDISSIDNESKEITGPKLLAGKDAPSRARQVIRSGDVLVSMTRPNLNAVAIVPDHLDHSVGSTGFHVLRPIEIDARWLFYCVQSRHFVDEMTTRVQGALYPAIRPRDIQSYQVPIPPFNEQKRIVAKIEELQARSRHTKEALKAIPNLLEQLRQSLLAAAFRGDLSKEWRKKNSDVEPASELLKRIQAERRKNWEEAELEKLKAKGLVGEKLDEEFFKRRKQYKEPNPVDATDLPELPETWCWASVDELSYSLDYGSSSKSSKTGKIPVLRMGNLQYGEIDWSDLVYTSNNVEIEKYRLSPNTVLFNRTNSPELVGKTGIYRGEQEAIFAGYLIRIQQVPQVRASYLNLMLNSPFIKILCLMVKSDAVSQSNINANKLSTFPIPLCSEAEQEAIVSKAEQVLAETNKRKRWVSDILNTLKQLDESILAKAFRGELVPQDPNDEPTSVLLERIREEKARKIVEQKISFERGVEMKVKQDEQRNILKVLQHSKQSMSPEEIFMTCGFNEESVDAFYEQLRGAVNSGRIHEIRDGDSVKLEAVKT